MTSVGETPLFRGLADRRNPFPDGFMSDTDDIIHRHDLLLRGVRVLYFFVLFVSRGLLYQVIEVFTKSGVHLLPHTHLLRQN